MRKMREVIAFVLYGLATYLIVATAISPLHHPKPFTFQVALPKTAEVLPSTRVHPGTFKLEVPWSELADHAPAPGTPAAIVSFGGNKTKENDFAGFTPSTQVEAYLARGDSTFYHAEVTQTPDWPYGFLVGRVERHGNQFTAYPELAAHPLVISGLLGVASFVFGRAADPRPRKKVS